MTHDTTDNTNDDPMADILIGADDGCIIHTHITLDDGTIVDADTGEIVGIEAMPYALTTPTTADNTQRIKFLDQMDSTAEWFGDRQAYHLAKADGLRAEKAAYQKIIDDRFDAEIKRHDQAVDWLRIRYYDPLLAYARLKLEGTKSRTYGIGILMLRLTKTRPSTKVVDDALAHAWASEHCQDAINYRMAANGAIGRDLSDLAFANGIIATSTIQVSNIPDDIKTILDPATTGLQHNPGGADELKFDLRKF